MSHIQASSGDLRTVRGAKSGGARASGAARLFFPAVALLLLAMTAWGFGPFYTKGMAYPGREIAPPIKTVVIIHAVVMSAWMILLVVQPTLISLRRHRLHMTLGKVGAVIALLVCATGLMVAIRSAQVTPGEARIWGLPPKEFFIVPFTAVFIFGAFVALAIAYRKKPAIHRAMMIVGTLSIMSAPISRIDVLNNLYVGTVMERLFGPFFITDVLAVLLVVLYAAIHRFDRLFAAGVAIIIGLSWGIWQAAPTEAWLRIASMFV